MSILVPLADGRAETDDRNEAHCLSCLYFDGVLALGMRDPRVVRHIADHIRTQHEPACS